MNRYHGIYIFNLFISKTGGETERQPVYTEHVIKQSHIFRSLEKKTKILKICTVISTKNK